MTPEGKVKAKVKKLLDLHGAWYIMPYQAGFTRRGIPDVIGVLRGHMFAVEVKAAEGKTTLLQERELEQLRHQGCTAIVISTDEDVSLFAAWLSSIGESNCK